jgi:hypothetical protein
VRPDETRLAFGLTDALDCFTTLTLRERMIMSIKRLLSPFLFLAVLSSFGGAALAQSVPQQFVVTYVEFKAANTKSGAQTLKELAASAEASSGVVNFDVLQQIDRPNFSLCSRSGPARRRSRIFRARRRPRPF